MDIEKQTSILDGDHPTQKKSPIGEILKSQSNTTYHREETDASTLMSLSDNENNTRMLEQIETASLIDSSTKSTSQFEQLFGSMESGGLLAQYYKVAEEFSDNRQMTPIINRSNSIVIESKRNENITDFDDKSTVSSLISELSPLKHRYDTFQLITIKSTERAATVVEATKYDRNHEEMSTSYSRDIGSNGIENLVGNDWL